MFIEINNFWLFLRRERGITFFGIFFFFRVAFIRYLLVTLFDFVLINLFINWLWNFGMEPEFINWGKLFLFALVFEAVYVLKDLIGVSCVFGGLCESLIIEEFFFDFFNGVIEWAFTPCVHFAFHVALSLFSWMTVVYWHWKVLFKAPILSALNSQYQYLILAVL